MKIQINQADLSCRVSGSGHPLLLVHGFPLDHSMWNHQIDELSQHFQVIAPDLRGFGDSTNSRESLSMELFASDLSDLLRQIVGTTPVCFCGLSMGGYVGWQFARHYPDQLAQLIQCDTRSVADDETTERARRITAQSVLQNGSESLAIGMMERLFAEQTRTAQPGVVEATQQVIRQTDRKTIANSLIAMANRPDMSGWIQQIDFPTLMVVGEHDQISTPAEMRQIADTIPNSQFVEIAGAGHMAPLEKPAQFNQAVISFLANPQDRSA